MMGDRGEMRQEATMSMAIMLLAATPATIAASPTPSGSPDPLRPVVSGGPIEMRDSGFAITFPDGWTMESADPDPDVLTAEPGTAWVALQANSHDGSMACSLAVGVAALPLRGSKTGHDDVAYPFWDPDEPDLLWVPTPYLPGTGSFHETSWIRRQSHDGDVHHDVQYELLCAANNAVVARPAAVFELIMASFELLAAEE